MKQSFFFLITIFFFFTSCKTNSSGVDKAFSKYAHKEGVTSITVPGWLVGIGATVADVSDEEQELLESIDKVKVLVIENEELNASINLHEEFHAEINKNKEFEELLTIHDKGEDVTIFGKMSEDVIEEMVILVGGDDNVMIYLKGEIKPEMINNFTDLTKSEKLLGLNF